MTFNFKSPDYQPVFQERMRKLAWLREDAGRVVAIKAYYRENIADFISDWGMTLEPRNLEIGSQVLIPFILFQKQRDWIDYVLDRWRSRSPGLTEKSRDGGLSWLAISFSCGMCLFNKDMSIGFGSRKEELVDRIGFPKSLFHKARVFMQHLPTEFRGGWDIARNAPHMRIDFPETHSVMSGEAGDDIGRGDRTSIYFVDEAAHIERPQRIDSALSETTNCRQDISSVNGMANSFALKRFSGKIKVFTFHWRDDPRKDDAWYAKKCDDLVDPIVIAQELDINYQASVEGVVIPALWVSAAVDAHVKLGIEPSGAKRGALDVADTGIDKNAFAMGHGVVCLHAESWSGSDSDIYATTERAFRVCDMNSIKEMQYDADGLGAGVRGDARKVNEERVKSQRKPITVTAYRGSGEVLDPDKIVPQTDRTNKDFFCNRKAQSWWHLRFRFQATYRAIKGQPYNKDDIISISSEFPERSKLCVELSQATYSQNNAGKLVVDKAPDGIASPNIADAFVMCFSPRRIPMIISPALLDPKYAQAAQTPLDSRQYA